MGGPSVTPSHGHHHDAPASTGIASPSGKTLPSSSTSSSSASATEATSPAKKTVDTSTDVAQEEVEEEKVVVKKREDYISWDDYFMGVAFLSAMRSKDPSTQVGACLVDEENKIVGIGTYG